MKTNCHSAIDPQDVVGEAPSILVEPVLDVLCSEHLEVQHEGKIPLATQEEVWRVG